MAQHPGVHGMLWMMTKRRLDWEQIVTWSWQASHTTNDTSVLDDK